MAVLDELFDQFAQRDRRALSRIITLIARGELVDEIGARLQSGGSAQGFAGGRSAGGHQAPPGSDRTCRVIAVTGGGGVGKSSLIGKLIDQFRRRNHSVAVLACDPQSSVTGGALLGDRIRMPSRPTDGGLFIRSLAAPSGNEAIAPNIRSMVQALDRYGFDLVILETVGAGQGDTAVRAVADLVVVLVQPETGDELQWEKAGQLEIADIVVVHKADLPGADRVESQLQEILNLSGGKPVTVLRVSASKGQGIEQLCDAITNALALDLTK